MTYDTRQGEMSETAPVMKRHVFCAFCRADITMTEPEGFPCERKHCALFSAMVPEEDRRVR
jgi:hypothetical protein